MRERLAVAVIVAIPKAGLLPDAPRRDLERLPENEVFLNSYVV